MKLKPNIASYSRWLDIQQYLSNESVLEVVALVAQSPRDKAEIANDVLEELIEMHILVEKDGLVKLNTAVFLENDILSILESIKPCASELANLVLTNGRAFQHAPAEIIIFLGGIIGFVQGVGMKLTQKNPDIWAWKSYTGKYPSSKIDFDEICEIYNAIEPDYLIKSVLQGDEYTAVFIGPGGLNFEKLIFPKASDENRVYIRHLNRYLADAYAKLTTGEILSAALSSAAEAANLFEKGKPKTLVVTDQDMEKYSEAVQAIIEAASDYYAEKQPVFEVLLRSTTAGKQGVAPMNQYMNLSRYIRKLTVKELYAKGFFKDSIPEDGCLTVFYKNDVGLIRQLLL